MAARGASFKICTNWKVGIAVTLVLNKRDAPPSAFINGLAIGSTPFNAVTKVGSAYSTHLRLPFIQTGAVVSALPVGCVE